MIAFAQVNTAILNGVVSLNRHRLADVRTPATVGAAPGRGQKPARYLTVIDRIEEWRPVVGWEGLYEVSDQGRVRSLDRLVIARTGRKSSLRGKVLAPRNVRKGYVMANLCRPGLQKYATIHRLVCEAFNGPPPDPSSVVRHLNGTPNDNRPENLTWGTCAENTADMVRHGRAYWLNQTHCIRGHEFTPENTRLTIRPNGGQVRNCRACGRIRSVPKNAKRDQAKRDALPILICDVCSSTFRNAMPRTRFCSSGCRRISRRKEFGWQPRGKRAA